MYTTGLIVELLVIGFNGLVWILLIAFSVFGYEYNIDVTELAIGTLPTLCLVYVVGIVTDRVADMIFEKLWADGFKNDLFKSRTEYHDSRTRIIANSDRLAEIIEGGRSRIRICRGCAFNSFITIICFNIFLWARVIGTGVELGIALFGNLFLTLLCIGLWFAWKKLITASYIKIREQSKQFS